MKTTSRQQQRRYARRQWPRDRQWPPSRQRPRWPALIGAAAMTMNLLTPALRVRAAEGPSAGAAGFGIGAPCGPRRDAAECDRTATPIRHLVVIYDENVSFDHYFATYPDARNLSGEPPFYPAPYTPAVNNLSEELLTDNPNFTNSANAAGAANPFRLDRTQAATADQDHNYTPEQLAFDGGRMDLFPEYTGTGTSGGADAFGTTGQVMGYYDGNTVTALWNYAQHFAMSDNAHGSTFGPSTPGALEAISGQTNGFTPEGTGNQKTAAYIPDGQGGYTDIGDIDPAYDTCTTASDCGSGIPLPGLTGQPAYGRCGLGPRLPFMVISPYAKPNYVSHTLITQASIVRFIEDNWLNGERLGGGSFDATTGSIMDMFDFGTRFLNSALFLDEDTGEPVGETVDHPGPFPLQTFNGR